MKIPFVDLKAQYHSIKNEIDQAISEVIEASAFVGGRHVKDFEQNFAGYIGVKNCVGVGNGTDALYIALKALGVSEGNEVITAANTFIATAEAVTLSGAKVKFVDCNSETYNIDIDKLEQAIVSKTKAIIPVHLYGQPAEMEKLKKVAEKHDLYIVEDAAQAHGAVYKNQRIGTIGDIACFSFFPGKNLGAYGDAGAIVTNNDGLAENARMLANHGRKEKYNHEFEGINSRIDGLQAAVLDVKLKYLDNWIERRRAIARKYDRGLEDIVITPTVMPGVIHVYHLYVIRTKNRQILKELLAEKGIVTGIHYPIPLPFLKAYDYLGHKPADFPAANSMKDEILSLPIHGDMTDEQVEYVIKNLRDILKKIERK